MGEVQKLIRQFGMEKSLEDQLLVAEFLGLTEEDILKRAKEKHQDYVREWGGRGVNPGEKWEDLLPKKQHYFIGAGLHNYWNAKDMHEIMNYLLDNYNGLTISIGKQDSQNILRITYKNLVESVPYKPSPPAESFWKATVNIIPKLKK